MFIIALAAAVSSISPAQHNVPDFLWDDVWASGYTKRITPIDPPVVKKVQVKRKPLIAIIPQVSPLEEIIARVKRENGIDRKAKS